MFASTRDSKWQPERGTLREKTHSKQQSRRKHNAQVPQHKAHVPQCMHAQHHAPHLLHDAWQVLDVHDQVVVLGDGARHLHDGRLLEAVSADQLARHLDAADNGPTCCRQQECITRTAFAGADKGTAAM
jgi:hypothetical protein